MGKRNYGMKKRNEEELKDEWETERKLETGERGPHMKWNEEKEQLRQLKRQTSLTFQNSLLG